MSFANNRVLNKLIRSHNLKPTNRKGNWRAITKQTSVPERAESKVEVILLPASISYTGISSCPAASAEHRDEPQAGGGSASLPHTGMCLEESWGMFSKITDVLFKSF